MPQSVSRPLICLLGHAEDGDSLVAEVHSVLECANKDALTSFGGCQPPSWALPHPFALSWPLSFDGDFGVHDPYLGNWSWANRRGPRPRHVSRYPTVPPGMTTRVSVGRCWASRGAIIQAGLSNGSDPAAPHVAKTQPRANGVARNLRRETQRRANERTDGAGRLNRFRGVFLVGGGAGIADFDA